MKKLRQAVAVVAVSGILFANISAMAVEQESENPANPTETVSVQEQDATSLSEEKSESETEDTSASDVNGQSAPETTSESGAEPRAAEEPAVNYLEPAETRPQHTMETLAEQLPASFKDAADDGTSPSAPFRVGNEFRIPAPTPGGSGAGEKVAGLEDFYNQKVNFSANTCVNVINQDEIPAGYTVECGWVIVPVDYSKPAGDRIAVMVSRTVKDGTAPTDGLFFNYGGPGYEAAGHTIVDAKSEEAQPLLSTYAFIGMDPRGTGASLPFVQCSSDEAQDWDRYPGVDFDGDPQASGAAAFRNDCFENTGKIFGFDKQQRSELLRNLNTENTARDMDIVRSVLGYSTMNYVGYSYGTRLGYNYQRLFTTNVGRMILDSAINPLTDHAPENLDPNKILTEDEMREQKEQLFGQASGAQSVFEEMALWCKEQERAGKTWSQMLVDSGYEHGDLIPNFIRWYRGEHGGSARVACALNDPKYAVKDGDLADDNPQLSLETRQFQNLARTMLNTRTPGTTVYKDGQSYRRIATFEDAVWGTRAATYSKRLWPAWVIAIDAFNKYGDATGIQKLHDDYLNRGAGGIYRSSDSAFAVIKAADSARPDWNLTNAKLRDTIWKQLAPFTSSGGAVSGAPCVEEIWPFSGTLPKGTVIDDIPQTMVIAGLRDNATPYPNSLDLARLIGASHVTVDVTGHGNFLHKGAEYECVNKLGIDYLLNGTLPADKYTTASCTVKDFRAASSGSIDDTDHSTQPNDPVRPTVPSIDWSTLAPSNTTSPTVPSDTSENQPKDGATAVVEPSTVSKGKWNLPSTGSTAQLLSGFVTLLVASGATLIVARRRVITRE